MLNQLNMDLTGGFQLQLPLFFPNPTTPLDDGVPNTGNTLTLTVTNLSQLLNGLVTGNVPAGTVTVNPDRPDLAAAISNLDLLTILKSMFDGFDFVFQRLDSALDSVLNKQLPLIGLRLNQVPAFSFFDTLVSSGLAGLSSLNSPGFTFGSVRTSLQNALAGAFPGATVSLDQSIPNEVKYVVAVGSTINQTIPLQRDLGFSALGLDINTSLNVGFQWSANFTIGANLGGFFFDVSANPELQMNLNVSLPSNTSITGSLGFLQVLAKADPIHPTVLSGGFAVNLLDPGTGANNNNRVTLDELSSVGLANLNQLVNVVVTGNADAHFDLELSSTYDLSDLPLLHLPPVSLPKILADLDATWNLNDPTNPQVGFGNIQLDMGNFFKSFGEEMFGSIDQALDPIRPALDVITRRIPVLSDINAVENRARSRRRRQRDAPGCRGHAGWSDGHADDHRPGPPRRSGQRRHRRQQCHGREQRVPDSPSQPGSDGTEPGESDGAVELPNPRQYRLKLQRELGDQLADCAAGHKSDSD